MYIVQSIFTATFLGLPLLTFDRGRAHFDLGGAYLVILAGQPHKLEDSTRSRFPVLALRSMTWIRSFIN